MITMQQFLLRQPSGPQEQETDRYYLDICNRLIEIAREKKLFPSYPEKVVERAALCLIGYYQDVISDAGIWRSFIDENRRLYGYTVPFYKDPDDYIDYEMNLIDIRFMVWYALSMNYENKRVCYPLEKEILEGADIWFDILSEDYEDAPIPEGFRLNHELDMFDPEDKAAIFHLGQWLFMHCYLMVPAYALTLGEIASKVDLTTEEGLIELQKLMDESMMKDPTGPLALYIGEWLYLIIQGKIPEDHTDDNQQEHKYFSGFTKATQGKTIAYFKDYESMNEFFHEALGWAKGENHLPQLMGRHDYVLMVEKSKGMLVAVDIARCIKDPDNPLYDEKYAKEHAMSLLTERGKCPGDLLKRICKENWLPDASFPETQDTELVRANNDFIARCYLQEYYRGD